MQVQRVATAALVVLAVSGMASLGAGTAFADGPTATATGGSSTAADAFQQNTAQSSRQNNNCVHANNNEETITLSGGRLKGRCVTADGSLSKFSQVRSGGADAAGGSGLTTLAQQNTAQRGRQNNNCAHLNESGFSLNGGRVEGRCTDRNTSLSDHTLVHGGGAEANGGSGTGAFTVDVNEQNTAQEGRQNNNCVNQNNAFDTTLSGARTEGQCENDDASRSKYTQHTSGGAAANGGGVNNEGFTIMNQQNTAQEGRQNTNCASLGGSTFELTGGRTDDRCRNRDTSLSDHALTSSGGANANGGSGSAMNQQNTAQEGRQNANCGNPNGTGDIILTGGRSGTACRNTDGSRSLRTLAEGSGANANGGSSDIFVTQQNTAQAGRQNTNCGNLNASGNIAVTGGAVGTECSSGDSSFSRAAVVRSGGADANGGSTTGSSVAQQNTAQEGRQNTNCGNLNLVQEELSGARRDISCDAADRSSNVGTAEIGGGAEADGGSSAASLVQQNTAQEGRQNNSCANLNNLALTASGARDTSQCQAADHSTNISSVYR
ncbi:hypothetical protein [Streptomyces sp. NPDC048639]|uniref:hypothetical protein n=1 Tax=Streptomyces sp. NPDC048639 TaxID=3365581 RepID=UPI00371D32DD